MSAAAEMKSLMITLLGIVIMTLPAITISILYSLPSQAIAQYTAGTPYPYNPGGPAAAPPYSSAPPSYPYTQTPQQQQPLPALPSSPSSPQYILPSPQNPSLNTQQTLPPQSSSPLLAQPSSPSSSSSTNNTSAANITSTGTPPLSNPMQPQQRQLQPSQLPGGSIMTGPQMSSLTVITHLNNTDTGSASSPLVLNTSNNRNNNDNGTASFHQVVTNAYANPDGYTVVYHFFRGSQTGVVLNLPPGIYSVSDQSSNNTNNNTISNKTSSPTLSSTSSHLTHTYSGDCNNVRSIAGDMVGYGQINLGEAKTCIITYNNS
jgi:hypothetical protein